MMHGILRAMGDGDLSASPILQKTLDWVFDMISKGKVFETTGGVATTEEYFDLLKYERLHDFFNNETQEKIYLKGSLGLPDESVEDDIILMEALTDEAFSVVNCWISEQPDKSELLGLTSFMVAGVLTEIFKLEIASDVFEKEFVKRCTTPDKQTAYRNMFGTEKAIDHFPESPARKRWLEIDFGM